MKRARTKEEIHAGIDQLRPWFHFIDLGDGLVTKTQSAVGEPVNHPEPTWERVSKCLPKNLTNKTVLDVGCNAGFYAIQARRRGAARVVGVDAQRNLIRQAKFVRDVLGLDIEYQKLNVYDLDPRKIGQFDITLALGLVYHCKHLVLALEKLFSVTRELLILETAIYPTATLPLSSKYTIGENTSELHPIAYASNPPEAKESIYNWFLPSVEALRSLLINVGFDEVNPLPTTEGDRAILVCTKREPYPDSRALSYLAAKLSLSTGVSECSVNEELSFVIRTENSGLARWLKVGEPENDRGAVHLVAHVLDENDEPVSWYHAGAFLPSDIAPGEVAEIEIRMRAPEIPGRYELEFDMISEHIAWFDDLGSEVLRHKLIVK